MTGEPHVLYRVGVAADAAEVALLHADSWCRHYRGTYRTRISMATSSPIAWRFAAGRMAVPREDRFTIVAQTDSRLVGFVHVVLDADQLWGALLDNLHVTDGLKRHRIGSTLLQGAARMIVKRRPTSGMYLWVREQNMTAQGFYEARGGRRVERDRVAPPGGDPTAPQRQTDQAPVHSADPRICGIPILVRGLQCVCRRPAQYDAGGVDMRCTCYEWMPFS